MAKKHTQTHSTHTERSSRASRLPSFTQLLKEEKTWSIFFAILFLAIAITFCIDVRLQSVNLDVADDWARSSLDNQGMSYMTQLVKQQYPTLPDAQVQQAARERWDEYRKANVDTLKTQQDQIAAQLRDNYQFTMADGTQQTYVFEMDPYLWWQMALNQAQHGSACELGAETRPDGTCYDGKRLAPIGVWQGPVFHVIIEGWLIKAFANSEAPALDSLRAVFYLPVILLALAMIPAFFLGRRLAGNIGGFVSAMIMAAHPVILNRTVAGWADTDPYAIIFPLFMLWLAIEAFRANRWWTRVVLATLAGFSTALYAYAWGGWWFTFFVILVCMLAYILYEVAFIAWSTRSFKPKAYAETVPGLAVTGVYLVASALFVSLFNSWSSFSGAFLAPFQASTGLQAATASSSVGWPNILTTVAELNIPGLSAIIQNFGGAWLVTIAAFGLFVLLLDPRDMNWKTWSTAVGVFVYYTLLLQKGLGLQAKLFLVLFALPLLLAVAYIFLKKITVDLRASVFIMGWLLATFFASTQGVRFVLLGVPAFAVGFGIAIGWTFIAVSDALIGLWKRPVLTKGIVGALLLFLVFNPVAAYDPIERAYAVGKQQAPGINDAWWNSMTVLREQTPQDTIVTSWWDFGHWFRNIGNRSVTFDGGSQNPEPGHWVGKVLLTNDEDQALGILRMLNCGQNTAYDTAHETLDVVPAKRLIDEIVVLDRKDAQKRLAQTTLSSDAQARILERTHCEPRPQVFITSGDMIGKAGVWGHFGSWNFERSMAYLYTSQYSQQEALAKIEAMGLTNVEAASLYAEAKALPNAQAANTWISSWPNYITQSWIGCTPQNGTVRCSAQVGYQQSADGVIAIDALSFKSNNVADAALTLGVYNNGARVGELVTRPTKIAYLARDAKTLKTVMPKQDNVPAGLFVPSVLIRESGTADAPTYTVLFGDPQQVDSMFTQLYFLDGTTMPHFTKRAVNVEMGGSVITLWDVTFPEE